MRDFRVVKLEVDGSGATYSAGGVAKIPLSQLAAHCKTGADGQTTLLAGIFISASQTVANASGGAIVLEHEKTHDFFRRIMMGNWLKFPNYGGQWLRIISILMGLNPEHRTDDSINNSASATQKLRYFIPCIDFRMKRPKDLCIPARALRNDILEVNFANGASAGEYGSGVSISAGSIVEVSAILIDVDRWTTPVKWCWHEQKLTSKASVADLIAGVKYTDVHICPAQSPSGGYATTPLTAANCTKVEYTENELLVRNTLPQQLVSLFNLDIHDGALALPRYELDGANQFIPVKFPSRNRRTGFTESSKVDQPPRLDLTGTIGVTDTYLLTRYIFPTLEDEVVNQLVAAGIKPSDELLASVGNGFANASGKKRGTAYVKAQSEAKTAVRQDKWPYLPKTVVPEGVK